MAGDLIVFIYVLVIAPCPHCSSQAVQGSGICAAAIHLINELNMISILHDSETSTFTYFRVYWVLSHYE